MQTRKFGPIWLRANRTSEKSLYSLELHLGAKLIFSWTVFVLKDEAAPTQPAKSS